MLSLSTTCVLDAGRIRLLHPSGSSNVLLCYACLPLQQIRMIALSAVSLCKHCQRVSFFRDALDAALHSHRPDVVHSMLDELAARGGLHAALAGRDAGSLLPLLKHLQKYITDPRHSSSLSGVTARILDLYAPVVHTNEEVGDSLLHVIYAQYTLLSCAPHGVCHLTKVICLVSMLAMDNVKSGGD